MPIGKGGVYISYTDEQFKLGRLCKNGHNYNDTGKSLRYTRKTDGSLGNCVTCSREKKRAELLDKKQKRIAAMLPEGFKRCPRCRSVLDKKDFGPNKCSKDGLASYCSKCVVLIGREAYYKKDPNTRKQNSNRWRQNNWMTHLLAGCRSSAKFRNLPFSITVDDITELMEKQEGRCYWLGIVLGDYSLPSRHPNRPSIDRLDNTKGYEKGNIVLSSCFANLGRSNTSAEDFKTFIDTLKSQLAYNMT